MGQGTDEVENVALTGTVTGGTFTLTYEGQTTIAIPYNASAGVVQADLVALSNIGSGDVAVASNSHRYMERHLHGKPRGASPNR